MREKTLLLCLLLLVLGLVLSLTACGPKEEQPPAELTQEETVTTPTEEPAPEAPATETPTPETPPTTAPITEASPEEIFAGSSAALQGLESYRYLSLFKFETEEEAKITAGSVKIEGEYIPPDKERVVWTDLSTGEKFEVTRIGDKAWMKEDDEWTEVPVQVAEIMMQTISIFSPAYSWGTLYEGLPDASNLIDKEVVNGISCFHYASSYNQWGATFGEEITEAKGDIWIAEEGFPVKYLFKASGTDPEGDSGSVEWSMELKDVNQPISIEPPM
ncbi:hypothetical protein KAU37_08755 [Candidatus Bipolaricaulota bacterium]|nr:hypothetical protein [Candidatus Bipolaricaulota bacterium]